MRIPRFFASGEDLKKLKQLMGEEAAPHPGSIELAEDDLIKQLRSVLRLGHGDRLLLLDGEGAACELSIDRMEKTRAVCMLNRKVALPADSGPPVRVGVSLIKADRFEWCLEKLTELGAEKIVPVLARHCVVRIGDDAKGESRLSAKLKRWQSIAREAAEQCERRTIPPVVKPVDFNDFVAVPTGGGISDLRFICVERLSAAPLAKALRAKICTGDPEAISRISSISLLVGPEGGFADEEIALAQNNEWQPVTLGQRILRSETAAIVAMSQVASILDI